jgi:D-psicose/D-tagatose/L-ribulose 3-epimerase
MRFHRRGFLKGAAAGLAGAGFLEASPEARKPLFNYSICNEVFEKWDFAAICRTIKKLGYAGLEISPFTLADSVDDISPARRKELRNIMHSEGVRFVGFHWLLITPKWLHATTADKDVRERTWQYLGKLVEFCGELGQPESGQPAIMVFGSPKQRGTGPGVNREQATKYLADGLAGLAPKAAARKITICLEALDHSQTQTANTLAEAVAIVKQINHPAIRTMFDYHNVADEKEPSEVLVRRYYPMIRHIHINEPDGSYPGAGNYDFVPVLKVLKEKNYRGWVSAEVFDMKPGAERIARETIAHLRRIEPRV